MSKELISKQYKHLIYKNGKYDVKWQNGRLPLVKQRPQGYLALLYEYKIQ